MHSPSSTVFYCRGQLVPYGAVGLKDVHTDDQYLFHQSMEGIFIHREQRVTGIMVFVLTGLSVKLAPILKAGCTVGYV
jgi:hypothetical protein